MAPTIKAPPSRTAGKSGGGGARIEVPAGVGPNGELLTAAQMKAAAKPQKTGTAPAEVSAGPSATETTLNGLGTVSGIGGMALGFGPMAAGAVGGVTGWVGKKTKVGFLERTGAKISGALKKFNEYTFHDLGKTFGISGASEKLQPLANGAATVSEKATRWSGLSGWRRRANIGGSVVAHESAVALAGKIDFDKLHPSLRDPAREMHSAITSAGSAAHLDGARIEVAGQKLKSAVEDLAKTDSAALSESRAMIKSVEKMEQAGIKAATKHAKAAAWADVKTAVKNTPKTLSKTSVAHAALNTAFITGSLVSIGQDTMTVKRQVATLKQMYTDMTGEKNPSTLRVLFGVVPPAVALARKNVASSYALKDALDIVNIGLNFTGTGMKTMIAFGVTDMLSRGVDNVLDTSAILPLYSKFHEAYKSGQAISAEDYAAFVALTSKDVKDRGGIDSVFAQELGKQYAAEKINPVNILKEISDGKLMVRIHGIIEANEAKKKQPTHVERLSGTAPQARETVGDHTKKVNAQAAARSAEGTSPTV